MQFTLRQYKTAPLILALLFLSGSVTFMILANLSAKGAAFMPSLSALFLALSLYTVGRFLAFRQAYRIGGEYADFSFSIHRIRQKTSICLATYELVGEERLIRFDRAGRKVLRKTKQKKLAVYTANLAPRYAYALLIRTEEKEGYLLLELNDDMKHALETVIQRAKAAYSATAD